MSFNAISLDAATDGLEFTNSVYLDGKEKHPWGSEHVGFYIHSITNDAKNRYGPRWVLDVSTVDEEPENRKIGLNSNPRRDALMTRLQERLEDGVIGPVQLRLQELEGGTSVWTIVAWTGDETDAA